MLCLKRVRPCYWFFALGHIVVPLLKPAVDIPLWSMTRFQAINFPLFIALADILTESKTRQIRDSGAVSSFHAIVMAFGMIQAFYVTRFATNQWIA